MAHLTDCQQRSLRLRPAVEDYRGLQECEAAVLEDGRCLQVREVSFDEQGLRVGTPGEWQALTTTIEGYQHQPGIRNVLRLKRFDPPAGPDMPEGPIYVPDMVVESEVVPE